LYNKTGITKPSDVPAIPPIIFIIIANLGMANAIKLIIKMIISRT